MATMRAVQVSRPQGPFEIVERELPEPGPGSVRIRVEACGICHSDIFTKDGGFPGVEYPRVPGHEVAGVIDAVGAGVRGWSTGQRVGVGWNGGYCGYCDNCRRGNFFACLNETRITGITYDGGYATAMIATASALARIPDELSSVAAAPLMCAGVTTFNALRNSGARPGDLVAVLGIGGLGHLAVQFAVKMGFRTIAIARGQDKESLARQLGAHVYIDNQRQDANAELTKMGGAKAILATAPDAAAMSAAVPALGPDGTLMVIGAGGPFQVSPGPLIGGRRGVRGWYSGVSIDSQDTLAFSALTGARPMTEVFPLDRVNEAYECMLRGKARFRVVLTTAG